MGVPQPPVAAVVGARVRALREERGLSIRALAKRAGLSPQVLSRTERALTEVSLTSLSRICVALGVTLPEFFDYEAVPRHPEFRSAAAQRAARLLSALPPDQAARLVRALETLFPPTARRPRR